MLYCFNTNIYIQIRPIKMAWSWLLHFEYLPDSHILKPGKFLIGHEKLSITSEQPNSIT